MNEKRLIPEVSTGESESGADAESPEANQAAQRKLALLLSPGFRNYGIRYMNLTEYAQLVQSQSSTNAVSIFREDQTGRAGSSFEEWLKKSTKDWSSAVDADTDWAYGLGSGGADRAAKWYKEILDMLKVARAKQKENTSDTEPESKRQEVMKIFRDMLLEHMEKIAQVDQDYDPVRNSQGNLEHIQKVIEKLQQRLKEWPEDTELKEELATYNNLAKRLEQQRQIIEAFLNDDSFLDSKENIRQLALAASEAANPLNHSHYQENYHVVVIFGPNAIRNFSTENIGNRKADNWGELDGKLLDDDDIMGTVVMIPDKNVEKEIIEASKRLGRLAHPVLNSRGLVKYPVVETVA